MSIAGPCGGQPGAIPRGGKGYGKGGFPSKRKMPLKGLRKGGYILVAYREKRAPGMIEEKVEYEGVIVDKRVGWDNRESYVELDDCLRLNAEGQVAAREGRKRLFDAFIDECEEVEKTERQLSPELAAAEGVSKSSGDSSTEAATAMMNMAAAMAPGMEAFLAMGAAAAASASQPMAPTMGMPMGMMPMGMMGMGGMPMGMMPMPMMGMMPMQMGMGGMPMGMMGMQMMPGMGMCGSAPMSAASAPTDASQYGRARSRSRSRDRA